MRLRQGRIAAIASSLPRSGAEVVTLDGRTLLRGLRDEHVHATQAALAALWAPLGGAGSAAEALDRMRSALGSTDGVVIGIGFQDGLWPDRPSADAIDALAAGREVVLISHDVHAAWLSAAAAQRFGVQPGPDGIVREAPAFAVGRAVNALAASRTEEAVAALVRRATALGVTSITDFEMAWSRDAWQQRLSDGSWSGLRIAAAVYPPDLERAAATGLATGDAVPGTDGLLTAGPLKTLIDGALNTRTAFCADPYPDGSGGLLTVAPDELRDLLRRAAAARLLPAVHAIGDAAVTVALDAFAATGSRGRIEHAQLVADADLPRFGVLGVAASVQPAHLLDDREVAEQHWPGRTGRAYPFRALLHAGATLLFGSDAPVAPLDPWRAIRAAVDRALPGGQAWHAEQAIPLAAALDASTGGRSMPRIGDAADLVALDDPPELRLPARAALTVVAGRIVHRAL